PAEGVVEFHQPPLEGREQDTYRRQLEQLTQLFLTGAKIVLRPLPLRDVGRNSQKPRDLAVGVSQAGDIEEHRQPSAVLPDVSPLVLVGQAPPGLSDQHLEAAPHFLSKL